MADEKSAKIRQFIVETFLFGDGKDLQEDTSFIENSILDSTGILEVITFLEEKFSIKIQDDELVPDNLDSIQKICGFLDRKLTCVE